MKRFDHLTAQLLDDVKELHGRSQLELEQILHSVEVMEKKKRSAIDLLQRTSARDERRVPCRSVSLSALLVL
jgi:hypothetical protein